jgi:hypothetical protein
MAILAILIGFWLTHAKHKILSRLAAFILFVPSAGLALLGVLTSSAVPPKVEGVYLHMKYNFLLNSDYLMQGKSSSFAFNEFFSRYVNLAQYYLLILATLLTAAAFILFILPKYEKA